MRTITSISHLRSDLARRRAATREHRRLVEELAGCTEAERIDLLASLERYPAEQTSQLRTILVRNAA